MSAVWILESASITVSGILASSPVPAQTAVVQGMRLRAVPSVSIMDLHTDCSVPDPCSQVVVATGVCILIPETCASLLDPDLCAPRET